jgi:hypothetical protein
LRKIRWIKAKFKTTCYWCHLIVHVRDSVLWHTKLKKGVCKRCGDEFIKWKEEGL